MRREPKVIIKTLKKNGGAVRKTARELGVSPGTVIFWRTRSRSLYGNLSTEKLFRKSTIPKKKRVSVLNNDEKIAIEHIRETKGRCAQKIKAILKIPHHHNTIHLYLKKRGYVKESGYYRRPRYQETIHMHTKNVTKPGKLQMDIKYVTPELSGLPHTLFLYAVIDIYSRYKQGVILPLLDQGLSIQALKILTPLLPFKPDFVQTDNGLEFQKRFLEFVESLGWQHHFIHKSTPNENAVIERSFRTDEEEFFFFRMKKPKDEINLNLQYQAYLKEYNEERPHLGINLLTPLQKIQECSICI
jgi:putative transposase